MNMSPRLASELAQVKKDLCEPQLAIFTRNIDDMKVLAAQGESQANAIRVLQYREGDRVKPAAMAKAISRAYGGWSKFARTASVREHAAPHVERHERSQGILDDRFSGTSHGWSVK